MTGAFYSSKMEQTAGSETIPLTLQKLHFLLFGIDDQGPLQYNIILPHRYSYTFQLGCVGGWKIIGGVNMHGEWNGMINAFADKNMAKPITERAIGSQGSLFGLCSPEVLGEFYSTIENCITEMKDLFKSQIHSQGLTETFPDIDKISSEEDRDKLSPESWQTLLTYVGLDMIYKKLAPSWLSNVRQKNKFFGDTFLVSLIDSYSSSYPTSSNRKPMLLLSDTCLAENVDILFRLCKVSAEIFVQEGGMKTQKDIEDKIKDISTNNWKPLTIDFKKLIPFLQELIGSPPESWIAKAVPEFTPGIFWLVQNVMLKPGYYSAFFPTKTWGPADAFYDLIWRSPTFNENIATAFATMIQIHEKPDKKKWPKENLIDALACRMLFSDRTKL